MTVSIFPMFSKFLQNCILFPEPIFRAHYKECRLAQNFIAKMYAKTGPHSHMTRRSIVKLPPGDPKKSQILIFCTRIIAYRTKLLLLTALSHSQVASPNTHNKQDLVNENCSAEWLTCVAFIASRLKFETTYLKG